MTEPVRWSAEVTPALLARAEPQLAALLRWADDRAYALVPAEAHARAPALGLAPARCGRRAVAPARAAPRPVRGGVGGLRPVDAVKVPWAKPAATDLSRVRSAAVAPSIACLFRRPDHRGLARILVLADDAARAAVVDALRRAGADVVEVPVESVPG